MPYGEIARAFDRAAENYDALYRQNPIMAWMRQESLAALTEIFPVGSRLLEIGCGTGDEAITLAQAGREIVATDIAPGMIRQARAKAEEAGITAVEWRVLPAGRIGELANELGRETLDGAYASFGALNCEPDLEPVVEALGQLVRPGGAMLCSVMNRWCLWEIGWGLLHLRPRYALRRLRPGWQAAGLASPDGTLVVPTRYYSPRTLTRALGPGWSARTIRGLPTILPPPYLSHLVTGRPKRLARLEKIERAVRDCSPFHSWGDHFLMVLVRQPPGQETKGRG